MRAYSSFILASTFITLSTVSVARADDVTQKAMAESLFQEGLDLFEIFTRSQPPTAGSKARRSSDNISEYNNQHQIPEMIYSLKG